jgi:acetolactate decarboxylase
VKQRGILTLVLVAAICGAALTAVVLNRGENLSPPPDRDVLFQVSTFDAILQSAYDGSYTVGNLTQHGDFGIGTLDALDGEMIVLDGTVYNVRTDGIAYRIPPDATTPFATVTFFEPDLVFTIPEAENLTALQETIDGRLPSPNLFYAVKITGTFPYVKARAAPRQEKPYPRLVDAIAKQSLFEFRNVTGTVIGFSTPEYVKGINVPGYHLHFLTADATRGGHILELETRDAKTEIDLTNGFAMALPTEGSFTSTELGADLSADTDIVEKGGTPKS